MRPAANKKTKNNKIIIIASISFCLLVLVLASIYYINQTTLQGDQSRSETENIKTEEKKAKEEVKTNDGNQDVQKEDAPDSQTTTNEKEQPDVVTDNGYIEGQSLPEEPTYVEGVLIANKKYPLPQSFNPGEDVEARSAFELMAQDAKKNGFELVAFSIYRSFDYQQTLYNNYVARDGKENADRYSARPGYSEHQTGLAFDIGEVGREDLWLTSEFGETEAGKWLASNAHKYGFILRYPQGKEDITGYMYESWHFRYLGATLATEIKKSGLTLEEYLGIN